MSQANFDMAGLLAKSAPAPAPRFTGFPKYFFIGGNGDQDEIPLKGLAEAAANVIARDGGKLAIYNLGQGAQGYLPLREFLVDKLNGKRGMSVSTDDILILSGSNQGITLINDLFVEEGDTVLVEEYSYSATINRLRAMGANIVGVKLDDDGIDIAALKASLEDLKGQGITPKFIYTIPTIQNPTGSVLPLDRRHALIDLAREYGFIIFEDECYADLAWVSDVPPSIYSLAPDITIHIGSFSKSLAPALRLGYAVADWSILGRMAARKSDGGTGGLDQMVAAEFFANHFDDHMAALNSALEKKRDTIIEALEREFGTSVEIYKPKGGIFVWLKIDGVDVRTLMEPAAKAGIVFNAGPDWACDKEASTSHLRLCFAMPSHEILRDGVAELARVCFEETGIPPRSANISR